MVRRLQNDTDITVREQVQPTGPVSGHEIEQRQEKIRWRQEGSLFLGLPLAFVYLELLLKITGGSKGQSITWVYLIGFSFAIGLLLTVLCFWVPQKRAGRVLGLVLLGLITILFLTEFFLNNAFQTYMDLPSVLQGMGDIATDFTGTALSAIQSELGYVFLFLLPFALCLLFWGTARHPFPRLRSRLVLLVLCVATICGSIPLAIIYSQKADRAAYTTQFQLDHGIRRFGLLTGLRLGATHMLFSDGTSELVSLKADEKTENSAKEQSYGVNQMELDFDTMIAEEPNSQIQQIHTYVSGQSASTKNAYTGLFKGKNLILITAEAFSAEAIDQARTPTLYRLANRGIVFTDYYQPAWGGSTSTGEYSILSGLVPTSGVASIKKTIGENLYFTIGNQLARQGYYGIAYHDGSYTYYDRHKTHENFGYSAWIGMGNGMEKGVEAHWPESDLEMMQFTVSQYIDRQPFSVYYMTVSGHCLYYPGSNDMTDKNWDAVKLDGASDAVRGYLAAQLELEYALEYLVEELETAGIAEDTVIVLSTDHYPYGLEKSGTWHNKQDYLSELYGTTVSNARERDHSALLIWSGSLEETEPIVVDTPVYSLDILPTLSNLFGVEYDSRLLVGRDVFSDQEPLVLWMDYSWLTDKGWYDAASGVFTPNEGITVTEDEIARVHTTVKNKIAYSKNVLTYDYFDILFGSQCDAESDENASKNKV